MNVQGLAIPQKICMLSRMILVLLANKQLELVSVLSSGAVNAVI